MADTSRNELAIDVRAVIVKRSNKRETETKLLEGYGVAVMVQDDGSVTIEVIPDSVKANGLRVYIGPDSAAAVAPNLAAWERIRRFNARSEL